MFLLFYHFPSLSPQFKIQWLFQITSSWHDLDRFKFRNYVAIHSSYMRFHRPFCYNAHRRHTLTAIYFMTVFWGPPLALRRRRSKARIKEEGGWEASTLSPETQLLQKRQNEKSRTFQSWQKMCLERGLTTDVAVSWRTQRGESRRNLEATQLTAILSTKKTLIVTTWNVMTIPCRPTRQESWARWRIK